MKDRDEMVKLTPIEKFFTESELNQMLMAINPQPNQCYRNNGLFAFLMKFKYPTIEYCEGINEGCYVHAFNSIIVDGVRYYIDFSGYYLEKKHGIPRDSYAQLLRTYTIEEIFQLFDKLRRSCCIIDIDGTFVKYLKRMLNKCSDLTENNRRILEKRIFMYKEDANNIKQKMLAEEFVLSHST